jgi:hypothetical protein
MKLNDFRVVAGLNIVLSIIIAVMALQMVRLKREMVQANRAAARQAEPPAGTTFPAFAALDSGGNPVRVDYSVPGADRTLLLVYSPTCPFCRATWPKWADTLERIDRRRLRIFAVDISFPGRSQPAARQEGIPPWITLIRPDPKVFGTYRFAAVPRAMVIDSGGRLSGAWTGLPSEDDIRELRIALGTGSK